MTYILRCKACKGRDLAAMDVSGTSDPFILMYILKKDDATPVSHDQSKAHKSTMRKTKVISKTLEPVWNEVFSWDDISAEMIENYDLAVVAFDWNRIKSADFMGYIRMGLDSILAEPQYGWHTLEGRRRKNNIKGEIQLHIGLYQQVESLHDELFPLTFQRHPLLNIIPPSTEDKKERAYLEPLTEFIRTEAQYCKDLDVLDKVWKRGLLERVMVGDEVVDKLFSNVEEIKALHIDILQVLQSCWDRACDPATRKNIGIGKVMVDLLPRFACYRPYCANHQQASEVIKALIDGDEDIRLFCYQVQQEVESCKLGPITGFLIKPIQRLCKYPLLLKELIKNNIYEEEEGSLQQALSLFQATAGVVNEHTKRKAMVDEIKNIQDALDSAIPLVAEGRELIRRGNVELTVEGKTNACELILFNDMLLFATRKKKGKVFLLEVLTTILLSDVLAIDLVFRRQRSDMESSTETLKLRGLSTIYQITISGESWFNVLEEALEQVIQGDTLSKRNSMRKSGRGPALRRQHGHKTVHLGPGVLKSRDSESLLVRPKKAGGETSSPITVTIEKIRKRVDHVEAQVEEQVQKQVKAGMKKELKKVRARVSDLEAEVSLLKAQNQHLSEQLALVLSRLDQ